MAYRAFLDANVLMPARVRDILLTLADAGAYEPLWSPDVLDEVDRHLPPTMDRPSRNHLFRQMNRAYPEASTTWPEPLTLDVAGLVNEHDHHVVAASLWGHADVLVTDDGPLTQEVSALVDCQSSGVFVSYAIDAVGIQALDALIAVARRWSRDQSADDDLSERLLRWMGSRGWTSAADELARVITARHSDEP